jgi:glycosyltransferase involved in cell wall biosynthesis
MTMKVVHISPTYFDDSSLIGGGERYVVELSSWMSKSVDTTLVSFSSKRQSYRQGDLKIEIYPVKRLIHNSKINPLSFRYLASIWNADIVHVHHIHTLVSDVACLVAASLGKRVFVTDYGGGASLALNRRLPVFQLYQGAIAYSRFGVKHLPEALQGKAVLIKGGIDTGRFRANGAARDNKFLYVGRILPHKGINYLIEGFRLLNRSDYTLRIVGRVYSQEYYDYLKQLSAGSNVEFVHDADDERLIHEYQTSRVTVLPSVHTSYNGSYTAIPELMGFTLLESQACGTPVICTDAGAMSEFVEPARTGFVVRQNSAEALCDALRQFLHPANPEQQKRCQEWIGLLDWSTVVAKHLETYHSSMTMIVQ